MEVEEEGKMKEEEGGIESRIQQAMRSRIQHFRDQADSLTFEGVRRVLEKDLELDTYALDVHKRYVKQLLEKFLNGADDKNISKDTGENTLEEVKKEEEAEPPEEHETKEDAKELDSHDEEKMEDSPVMGLLTGNKSTKSGNLEAQGNKKKEIPSETTVKKAIWKRAAYLRAKSEEITVAGVRRLLEEDLQLDKYTLDPLKKLISKQLDEVLNSPKIPKSATPIKKKSSLNSQSKTSKKTSSIESSDSSDSERDDEEHVETPKKKVATKGKIQKSEGLKKRKRPAKEAQVSRKKQIKLSEEASEENSDGEDSGDTSDDGRSRSAAGKTVKKKEVLPPAYGKQVEHLKSIIKSCGMSVAPSVYKKAKQVPDDKREAFLIKELEEILSKEGLSADPSEKEIKEVKRRKERAKELEGIDTSNIVLSSRRRSTASFVAPPKPKPPVKSDGDDVEDSDNEDGDDDEDDGDDDDDSDSQSEELQEDDEDSD